MGNGRSSMKIQCSIKGFYGAPATIYSMLDATTGILVVQKSAKYRADRFSDCVLVSNANLDSRDVLFTPDDFRDAIDAFFELYRAGEVKIVDSLAGANPENKIEVDGVRDNGRANYVLASEISCTQIAVLASCWHVKRAGNISAVIDMQDRLLDILQGDFITI